MSEDVEVKRAHGEESSRNFQKLPEREYSRRKVMEVREHRSNTYRAWMSVIREKCLRRASGHTDTQAVPKLA